jgi:ABC-2 type transport system permease protein
MIKAVLYILDATQGFFRWLGADYEILRHIVEVKFIMQNRRPMAAFSNYNSRNNDQDPNNSFWIMVGIFGFVGLFMGLCIFFVKAPYYAYSLPFAYIMVMSVLTLVTDFSTLLLDTTDNAVLLPRPVNSRTILLARLVHITTYVLILSFGIAFFTLVFTLFKYGILAFLVCVLAVILMAILSVFLTALLYMALMQFTSEERLKDIISYFQIAFTMLVTVGYQLIGRLFNWLDLDNSQVVYHLWHYALPPLWMSGAMQLVIKNDLNFWIFALLTVAVPSISLWVLIKFLAPQYNEKIAQLGTGDGGGAEKVVLQNRHGFVSWLASKVTSNSIEKAIFELSWKVTSRDRRFKMRTYPSFGSLLPMVFVLGRNIFNPAHWPTISEGYSFLLIAYMAYVIGATFHSQTFFSEDFKAAWIYFSTPTDSPRDVVMGNIKAVMLKFYTPFYLLIAGFILWIWGYKVLDDLLLAYLLSWCITLFEIIISSNLKLPFAKSPTEQKEAGQTMQLIVLFFILPICGFGHWGLTYIPYAVPIACVLALFLIRILYKKYESLTWDKFDL